MLYGLNMDRPLLLSGLITYAAAFHGDTEVVSKDSAGAVVRTNYRTLEERARRVSALLTSLGVERGDRVATIAWNDHRHFACYYGIAGMGAVLHTVNPRLFDEQIAYILNHAEDVVVFVDPAFAPLAERLRDGVGSVKRWIVLDDEFDALLDTTEPIAAWPELDEREAAALCYTSGTTGNPKGVLYHHRGLVLQSFACCSGDGHGVNSRETVLLVVPMFHVNGWAMPFSCAQSGAKLVLPGPDIGPEAIHHWVTSEGVTLSAGVPTVWLSVVQHLEQHGLDVPSLRRVAIGGASAPPALIATLEDRYGVMVTHVWGMTEMTLGSSGMPPGRVAALPVEERRKRQMKGGRVMYGVDLEIVGEDGVPVAHDGVARGELLARGPWVAGSYYRGEDGGGTTHTDDGWLRTGDVATMDAEGYIEIVDRSKDMIKSGGEWISSIQLENEAVGCPGVAEAAVIALPHPRWQERPLLVVVRQAGATVTAEDVLAHLAERVAKWWLPDEVVFVEEIPHTGTGKIQKTTLRARFADHVLPTAAG